MDQEQELVSLSLEIYEKASSHMGKYMQIIPKSNIKGIAQDLARQYFKQNPGKTLDEAERQKLASQICRNIFDEILKKAHTVITINADGKGKIAYQQRTPSIQVARDGSQLFYRRALNKMAMDCYPDAERLLKRAVEIDSSYIEAWDALADVYEKNEKEDLAKFAREKIVELKSGS